MITRFILGTVLCGGLMADSDFDQGQAARFAKLALDCVHKEYPNKIAHSLNSDADVKLAPATRRRAERMERPGCTPVVGHFAPARAGSHYTHRLLAAQT